MRKPVTGWEGVYEVSDTGDVFSMARGVRRSDGKIQPFPEKKMMPQVSPTGYLTVLLSRPGLRKTFRVHRLVAIAFVSNPRGLHIVNHIDGNKQNPHASNLEWVTASENMKHAYHVIGVIKIPTTHAIAPSVAENILNDNRNQFGTYKQIAKKYGVHWTTVQRIVRLARKSEHGIKF